MEIQWDIGGNDPKKVRNRQMEVRKVRNAFDRTHDYDKHHLPAQLQSLASTPRNNRLPLMVSMW
jgi:hypothetical protein